MDEIEFDEAEVGACACCGASQQILTRYVSRNGEPFAIYKAALVSAHQTARAEMIVGFGEWEENTDPSLRTAFTFELWADQDSTNITFVDEENSVWSSGFFGKVVPREQAIQHPLVGEVHALAEHILRCDEVVKGYLA